ncbi:hypothetical protein EBZ39_12910 [bacterium]|nr:hypothetical protein [bacterium]
MADTSTSIMPGGDLTIGTTNTGITSTGTTNTGTGTTGTVPTNPIVGSQTGTESSLSNWAGKYVTDLLGRGQALSQTPYEAYTGPLTAAPSALQNQSFQGIANLTIPTNDQMSYTPQTFNAQYAQQYMNPYLMAALQPQIDEARRQSEIDRVNQAGRLTKAGAYGGGRQAIMESELTRNLRQNLANITGQGYKTAYDQAMNQFNTEQGRQMQATENARNYGLAALQKQADFGALQRGIEQEGINADIKQFEEEKMDPYKKVQFAQSLLSGMPLGTQQYSYAQPSSLSSALSEGGGLAAFLEKLFTPTK